LLRAARTGAGAARGGTCAARSGAGAGGRAAGRLALAAHFDVDATVGLQAGDQLRVGLVALALIARHGLAFAAAFRAHLALLDALLRQVVLDRLGALLGELLVVVVRADAVGVPDRVDLLHVGALQAVRDLVELLLAGGTKVGLV